MTYVSADIMIGDLLEKSYETEPMVWIPPNTVVLGTSLTNNRGTKQSSWSRDALCKSKAISWNNGLSGIVYSGRCCFSYFV